MTKVQEMQNKLASLKAEAQKALDSDNVAEGRAKLEEAKQMQAAIALQMKLDEAEKQELGKKRGQQKTTDAVRAFANAARTGFRNAMKEGTGTDGGYAVPEEIQTRINKYKETGVSLLKEIDVEYVNTNKGARTYQKRAQQTGLALVNESAKIEAGTTPQFELLEYSVKKYAGGFPVTNELLEDADESLASTLMEWIGNNARVGENNAIITAVKTKSATTITDLDDIKKALNVTLGQAFKVSSKIYTNDDGLHWIDTLKDSNGRYILTPNPVDPQQLQICIGGTTVPIVPVPNADFPTTGSKIPFIIGDLKAGIKCFMRKRVTIERTTEGSMGDFNAWEQDMTLFRAIERADYKVKDEAAFVYGELTTE